MKSALAALLISATFAPIASADGPLIPPESLNHFLSGVRDFAGGKLTPGPLYDPQAAGLPGGGASATIGVSLPMNYFNTGKPASWRAANGKLASGSIVRGTITPASITGQTIVRQNITPQQIVQQKIASPWGR